jgi:hypothetical protein
VSEVLYKSGNLKVFFIGPRHSSRKLLAICFQYKQLEQSLEHPGFAEEFFTRERIDALYVNCATNEWYQYPELPEVLSLIRSFASDWERIVTYGSSMGAYASLRFAGAIGAHCSISVAPQYSPRSSVIAGEDRFHTDIAQTTFLHEGAYLADNTITNYVLFDPLLAIDVVHVEAYGSGASLCRIPVSCGGHIPLIALVECGLIRDTLVHLLQGTFSKPGFRRSFRLARRTSPEYWAELTRHLTLHGHTDAASRCAEMAKEKLRKIEVESLQK